jgi:hypothetical protein
MKIISLLILAAAFSGCAYAPTTQLQPGQRDTLKGSTFSVASHPKVNAVIQTGGKTAMFGAFAQPYFASEGARVMREDNIIDPAIAMSAAFEKDLQSTLGMQKVDGPRPYTGPGSDTFVKVSAQDLLKFYPQGDYVLDVDTAQWWLMYNMIDGYHVIYQSYSRLLDRKTGQPVASHACTFDSNKLQSDQPSYDEMLADHSALLKSFLGKAADKCTSEFLDILHGKSS